MNFSFLIHYDKRPDVELSPIPFNKAFGKNVHSIGNIKLPRINGTFFHRQV